VASERKFVVENVRRVLLREYMMEQTKRAGFGGLDIQRTPMGTRVTLMTERPGLVIGRKGGAIKTLTDEIEHRFKFDNPQIEVQEVDNPSTNAQIMAEKLAQALEMGWHFRRAGHSTVRRIMDAGGKGCLVVISGKLTGQRHRTEKFKEGHIKFCGEPRLKWMDLGFAVAKLKPGIIGVKVQIMKKEAKLPDEIMVRERVVSDAELAEAKKAEEAAAQPTVEGAGDAAAAGRPKEAEAKPEAKPEGEAPRSEEPKPEKAPEHKPKRAPRAHKEQAAKEQPSKEQPAKEPAKEQPAKEPAKEPAKDQSEGAEVKKDGAA